MGQVNESVGIAPADRPLGTDRHGAMRWKGQHMRRFIISLTTTAIAAAAFAVAAPAVAAQAAVAAPTSPSVTQAAATASPMVAVPPRTDSDTKPVYFIHGFKPFTGFSCKDYWANALQYFRANWKGPLITFGYYSGDKECTVKETGNTSTPIRTVGRELAWDIFNRYTRHGISVDVVAHSMGGLIIRSALSEVAKHTKGRPAFLFVEDVVTLGTPHLGANRALICGIIIRFQQCQDMSPGSAFLRGLLQNPQSRVGTDWTLVGSDSDKTVSTASALGMRANHLVRYGPKANISHAALPNLTRGLFQVTFRNNGKWTGFHQGFAPVPVARRAVFFQHAW
jgi:hypothetical protein